MGHLPATVATFHDDESVEYETTAGHARFVVDRNVRSVFPLGTNGEFSLQTGDERTNVVECAVVLVGQFALVEEIGKREIGVRGRPRSRDRSHYSSTARITRRDQLRRCRLRSGRNARRPRRRLGRRSYRRPRGLRAR
ncbi:dihydrodipicolinate synthase family protein [Natronorubrum sp. DTA28]|uniref:dihydrodipicolinate synthase family protein n=1 Tax=Natronorubrum sp. DTA28 TaxID=3447019 RepID=UPI003F86F8CA